MTVLKKNKTITLKNKMVNVFMTNGHKHISEKMLLRSSKLIQKSSKKPFQQLVQLAVINTASTFKLSEQVMKKGRRKSTKVTPSFIIKDSLRIMTALKSIKITVRKSRSSVTSYENLAKEILAFSSMKGQLVEQKTKLQNQILLNKRYLSKFKW